MTKDISVKYCSDGISLQILSGYKEKYILKQDIEKYKKMNEGFLKMNEGLLIPKTLDYAVCQQQYHKDDSSEIKNKSLEMINGTFYHIIQREV